MRASFLVTFFGGVFGWAMFGMVNARRMDRGWRDGWIYVLGALGWAAAVIWFGFVSGREIQPDWLTTAGSPGRTMQFAGRVLALALLGLMYLRQQRHFRAQTLVGDDPPNPWPLGLASIGVGIGLTYAAILVGLTVAGGLKSCLPIIIKSSGCSKSSATAKRAS